jgi:hypothetical protein
MEKIPDMIFGKKHLSIGPLGDLAYTPPGKHYTCSPAIQGAPVSVEASIYSDTPVRAFTSGTQFESWSACNCEGCPKRNFELANAADYRREGGCALELRLALSYMGDGLIPFKTARRIGYDGLTIRRNGIFVRLKSCKEKPLTNPHS